MGEQRGCLSPCTRLSRLRLPLNANPQRGAGAEGRVLPRVPSPPGPASRVLGDSLAISLLRATLCPKYLQGQVPTSVSVVLMYGIQEVSGRQRHPEASSALSLCWDHDSFSLTV